MTTRTELEKNNIFAKWLAEWVKQNSYGSARIQHLPIPKRDPKGTTILSGPSKKTKSDQ
jgi:hypothetical protein